MTEADGSSWDRWYPKVFWTIVALACVALFAAFVDASVHAGSLPSDIKSLVKGALELLGLMYITEHIIKRYQVRLSSWSSHSRGASFVWLATLYCAIQVAWRYLFSKSAIPWLEVLGGSLIAALAWVFLDVHVDPHKEPSPENNAE